MLLICTRHYSLTYNDNLLLYPGSVDFSGGVLGESAVADHGVLGPVVVVVQRYYKRRIVHDRLAELECNQAVQVKRDLFLGYLLVYAGFKHQLLDVVFLVRCVEPESH